MAKNFCAYITKTNTQIILFTGRLFESGKPNIIKLKKLLPQNTERTRRPYELNFLLCEF